MVCAQTGAVLKVATIDDTGTVRMDEFRSLLGARTKLVAVTQVSNALGTVNPVREMIALAHAQGVPVLVDGAQAVAHTPVDVQALDCDFYAFSGHKLYAPTGIGALYGRRALLEAMPPWQGGGDMIRTVSFEGSTWNDLPFKFEAGTPHIAGAIGLGAAIDYLSEVGLEAVAAYEHELLVYGTALLQEIPGLRMIGTAAHKAAILSFVIDGLHAHDIGTVLDTEGVAIRAGHHCAMPVMEHFGVPATARASLAFYNTREDLDRLAQALRRAVEMFAR
jgi:cysteine desulfurase/selenocysteine lyase